MYSNPTSRQCLWGIWLVRNISKARLEEVRISVAPTFSDKTNRANEVC